MNKFKIELNESWLNGKFKNGEINTRIPYVASDDFFGNEKRGLQFFGWSVPDNVPINRHKSQY